MKSPITAAIAASCLIAAASAFPTNLLKRQDSCPADALSCSASSGDSCCTPENGLLVHVQQWSPGYGPSDAFTLHGLWPDTCNGGIPGSGDSGCDSSRNYDDVGSIIKEKDSSLYNSMNTYWPSNKGDNSEFWTHEWNKHGTCVTTLDPECYGDSYQKNDDVVDYFHQALDLRSKYDLHAILSKASITPGGSYSVSDIEDAIKESTGAAPKVTCSGGDIEEIWLYFHVKGKDGYVPTDSVDKSTCSGSVNYPKKN
ncbi:ribonuclease t2 [Lichtheimia corymbifera JMRC:FSU:9682]|uniref:ribonuclease T2 n=1 Tax=Lichtheimia corymbifera JMRC:FSU:9682 TaxID=1263082 RepID=A0A068RXU7_9FUNG|nr:ribonuclease t2 [Lichtheimia corymbifera JMRC:FSU:9682]